MTAAELIAELEAKDPDTVIVVDQEHHGWWSLGDPWDLQDQWVVRDGMEYKTVDEGTPGAVQAVRIY